MCSQKGLDDINTTPQAPIRGKNSTSIDFSDRTNSYINPLTNEEVGIETQEINHNGPTNLELATTSDSTFEHTYHLSNSQQYGNMCTENRSHSETVCTDQAFSHSDDSLRIPSPDKGQNQFTHQGCEIGHRSTSIASELYKNAGDHNDTDEPDDANDTDKTNDASDTDDTNDSDDTYDTDETDDIDDTNNIDDADDASDTDDTNSIFESTHEEDRGFIQKKCSTMKPGDNNGPSKLETVFNPKPINDDRKSTDMPDHCSRFLDPELFDKPVEENSTFIGSYLSYVMKNVGEQGKDQGSTTLEINVPTQVHGQLENVKINKTKCLQSTDHVNKSSNLDTPTMKILVEAMLSGPAVNLEKEFHDKRCIEQANVSIPIVHEFEKESHADNFCPYPVSIISSCHNSPRGGCQQNLSGASSLIEMKVKDKYENNHQKKTELSSSRDNDHPLISECQIPLDYNGKDPYIIQSNILNGCGLSPNTQSIENSTSQIDFYCNIATEEERIPDSISTKEIILTASRSEIKSTSCYRDSIPMPDDCSLLSSLSPYMNLKKELCEQSQQLSERRMSNNENHTCLTQNPNLIKFIGNEQSPVFSPTPCHSNTVENETKALEESPKHGTTFAVLSSLEKENLHQEISMNNQQRCFGNGEKNIPNRHSECENMNSVFKKLTRTQMLPVKGNAKITKVDYKADENTTNGTETGRIQSSSNSVQTSVLTNIKNLVQSPSTPWKRLMETNISSMLDSGRGEIPANQATTVADLIDITESEPIRTRDPHLRLNLTSGDGVISLKNIDLYQVPTHCFRNENEFVHTCKLEDRYREDAQGALDYSYSDEPLVNSSWCQKRSFDGCEDFTSQKEDVHETQSASSQVDSELCHSSTKFVSENLTLGCFRTTFLDFEETDKCQFRQFTNSPEFVVLPEFNNRHDYVTNELDLAKTLCPSFHDNDDYVKTVEDMPYGEVTNNPSTDLIYLSKNADPIIHIDGNGEEDSCGGADYAVQNNVEDDIVSDGNDEDQKEISRSKEFKHPPEAEKVKETINNDFLLSEQNLQLVPFSSNYGYENVADQGTYLENRVLHDMEQRENRTFLPYEIEKTNDEDSVDLCLELKNKRDPDCRTCTGWDLRFEDRERLTHGTCISKEGRRVNKPIDNVSSIPNDEDHSLEENVSTIGSPQLYEETPLTPGAYASSKDSKKSFTGRNEATENGTGESDSVSDSEQSLLWLDTDKGSLDIELVTNETIEGTNAVEEEQYCSINAYANDKDTEIHSDIDCEIRLSRYKEWKNSSLALVHKESSLMKSKDSSIDNINLQDRAFNSLSKTTIAENGESNQLHDVLVENIGENECYSNFIIVTGKNVSRRSPKTFILPTAKNLVQSPTTPWKRLVETNIDSLLDSRKGEPFIDQGDICLYNPHIVRTDTSITTSDTRETITPIDGVSCIESSDILQRPMQCFRDTNVSLDCAQTHSSVIHQVSPSQCFEQFDENVDVRIMKNSAAGDHLSLSCGFDDSKTALESGQTIHLCNKNCEKQQRDLLPLGNNYETNYWTAEEVCEVFPTPADYDSQIAIADVERYSSEKEKVKDCKSEPRVEVSKDENLVFATATCSSTPSTAKETDDTITTSESPQTTLSTDQTEASGSQSPAKDSFYDQGNSNDFVVVGKSEVTNYLTDDNLESNKRTGPLSSCEMNFPVHLFNTTIENEILEREKITKENIWAHTNERFTINGTDTFLQDKSVISCHELTLGQKTKDGALIREQDSIAIMCSLGGMGSETDSATSLNTQLHMHSLCLDNQYTEVTEKTPSISGLSPSKINKPLTIAYTQKTEECNRKDSSENLENNTYITVGNSPLNIMKMSFTNTATTLKPISQLSRDPLIQWKRLVESNIQSMFGKEICFPKVNKVIVRPFLGMYSNLMMADNQYVTNGGFVKNPSVAFDPLCLPTVQETCAEKTGGPISTTRKQDNTSDSNVGFQHVDSLFSITPEYQTNLQKEVSVNARKVDVEESDFEMNSLIRGRSPVNERISDNNNKVCEVCLSRPCELEFSTRFCFLEGTQDPIDLDDSMKEEYNSPREMLGENDFLSTSPTNETSALHKNTSLYDNTSYLAFSGDEESESSKQITGNQKLKLEIYSNKGEDLDHSESYLLSIRESIGNANGEATAKDYEAAVNKINADEIEEGGVVKTLHSTKLFANTESLLNQEACFSLYSHPKVKEFFQVPQNTDNFENQRECFIISSEKNSTLQNILNQNAIAYSNGCTLDTDMMNFNDISNEDNMDCESSNEKFKEYLRNSGESEVRASIAKFFETFDKYSTYRQADKTSMQTMGPASVKHLEKDPATQWKRLMETNIDSMLNVSHGSISINQSAAVRPYNNNMESHEAQGIDPTNSWDCYSHAPIASMPDSTADMGCESSHSLRKQSKNFFEVNKNADCSFLDLERKHSKQFNTDFPGNGDTMAEENKVRMGLLEHTDTNFEPDNEIINSGMLSIEDTAHPVDSYFSDIKNVETTPVVQTCTNTFDKYYCFSILGARSEINLVPNDSLDINLQEEVSTNFEMLENDDLKNHRPNPLKVLSHPIDSGLNVENKFDAETSMSKVSDEFEGTISTSVAENENYCTENDICSVDEVGYWSMVHCLHGNGLNDKDCDGDDFQSNQILSPKVKTGQTLYRQLSSCDAQADNIPSTREDSARFKQKEPDTWSAFVSSYDEMTEGISRGKNEACVISSHMSPKLEGCVEEKLSRFPSKTIPTAHSNFIPTVSIDNKSVTASNTQLTPSFSKEPSRAQLILKSDIRSLLTRDIKSMHCFKEEPDSLFQMSPKIIDCTGSINNHKEKRKTSDQNSGINAFCNKHINKNSFNHTNLYSEFSIQENEKNKQTKDFKSPSCVISCHAMFEKVELCSLLDVVQSFSNVSSVTVLPPAPEVILDNYVTSSLREPSSYTKLSLVKSHEENHESPPTKGRIGQGLLAITSMIKNLFGVSDTAPNGNDSRKCQKQMSVRFKGPPDLRCLRDRDGLDTYIVDGEKLVRERVRKGVSKTDRRRQRRQKARSKQQMSVSGKTKRISRHPDDFCYENTKESKDIKQHVMSVPKQSYSEGEKPVSDWRPDIIAKPLDFQCHGSKKSGYKILNMDTRISTKPKIRRHSMLTVDTNSTANDQALSEFFSSSRDKELSSPNHPFSFSSKTIKIKDIVQTKGATGEDNKNGIHLTKKSSGISQSHATRPEDRFDSSNDSTENESGDNTESAGTDIEPSDILKYSLECLLEVVIERGKIGQAFVADFDGQVLARTGGGDISRGDVLAIDRSLTSRYPGLTKLGVFSEVFTCIRCQRETPSITGTSDRRVFAALRGCNSLVVGLGLNSVPGSCIKEVEELYEALKQRGL
ncbi:hypothetical protein ElyMa_003244200 [Elysia marginata]|uniref:Uncharacterized protein n=1 Tax=Elysia marginata TaxID=1093978 RepID=A0AAV4J6K4_9GAST|nr:hypothetical protein ElyMa_003244200 [Elysia marginata]